jgi:hypothetical protein
MEDHRHTHQTIPEQSSHRASTSGSDKSLDKYMYDEMRTLSASLINAGIKDGKDLEDAAHYTNYALYGTPLKQMYGGNVKRLRKIKGGIIRSGSWISQAASRLEFFFLCYLRLLPPSPVLYTYTELLAIE